MREVTGTRYRGQSSPTLIIRERLPIPQVGGQNLTVCFETSEYELAPTYLVTGTLSLTKDIEARSRSRGTINIPPFRERAPQPP
jgi:hypothetical protein